jgi:hypothetical protein
MREDESSAPKASKVALWNDSPGLQQVASLLPHFQRLVQKCLYEFFEIKSSTLS